jgi:hypothetical protein
MHIKNLHFLEQIEIPELAECAWDYPCPMLPAVEEELARQLNASSLAARIKPGDRIAVTAGSRGIARIDAILALVCGELKRLCARPFIISAMGSHGGATQEGQREILTGYAITPERVGAPVICSTATIEIGKTPDGMPVFMAEEARAADGIIVINRIKAHTSFQSETESGLLKMLAVGLGRDIGARHIHQRGTQGLKQGIPRAARIIMDTVPVLLGIGIIENARGSIASITALEPDQLEAEEARLLKQAKALIPAVPFKKVDVLIVAEMGKNISGTGMDTAVIGRRRISGEPEPLFPQVSRIAVLSLSPGSYGNATGLGLADIITRQLYDNIDFEKTWLNIISSTFIERAKIPLIMPTDKTAVLLALATCWAVPAAAARVVLIKNTASLGRFFISRPLAAEARQVDRLHGAECFAPLSFSARQTLESCF